MKEGSKKALTELLSMADADTTPARPMAARPKTRSFMMKRGEKVWETVVEISMWEIEVGGVGWGLWCRRGGSGSENKEGRGRRLYSKRAPR
jgi:hypothetical protein